MAVRDDFTAGEVLAAADLNDTFASKVDYPTGGSDGDLLAKDGTDAEWIAVPEAGLTLITAESFSAVSTVSLDGCFSSDYQNYFMILRVSSSALAVVQWRYRASGSDATGSNYIRQAVFGTSTTLAASTSTTAQGFFDGNSATGLHWATTNLFGPFAAAETLSINNSGNVGPYTEQSVVRHNLSTSFDGITIFPNTGNITGNIRVYGYKD